MSHMRRQGARKRTAKLFLIAGMLISVLYCLTVRVYADADSSWYLANMEIMQNNAIVSSAIRYIVWGLTKILVLFANVSETIYDKAFGFIDFTTNPAVNSFIGKFKVVLVALTALSLLYLGLVLILQHEKKPKLMTNICFLIFCVCCSTWFFTEMNTLAGSFKDGVQSTVSASHLAYDTVDSHMADLVYLDKKQNGLEHVSWSTRQEYGAGIKNKKTLDAVDYTEVLNFNSSIYDYHGDTGSILKNKLVTVNPAEGEYKVLPLSNGVGWNSDDDADLFNEFYYRYTFNPLCRLGTDLPDVFVHRCKKPVHWADTAFITNLLQFTEDPCAIEFERFTSPFDDLLFELINDRVINGPLVFRRLVASQ